MIRPAFLHSSTGQQQQMMQPAGGSNQQQMPMASVQGGNYEQEMAKGRIRMQNPSMGRGFPGGPPLSPIQDMRARPPQDMMARRPRGNQGGIGSFQNPFGGFMGGGRGNFMQPQPPMYGGGFGG